MAKEMILDKNVNENLNNILKGHLVLDATTKLDLKNNKLYNKILTDISANTRNTMDQVNYLTAMEKSVAVFIEASRQLRSEMNVTALEQKLETLKNSYTTDYITSSEGLKQEAEKNIVKLTEELNDAVMFSNKYALFAAGSIGLGLLNSEKTETKSKYVPLKKTLDMNTPELIGGLFNLAADSLDKLLNVAKQDNLPVNDDLVKYTMSDVFTSWVNQFDWNTFKGVAEKFGVNNTNIKYDRFTVSDGKFHKSNNVISIDSRIIQTRRSEIIGGGDFEKSIWDSLLKMAHYDPEAKKNASEPPYTIFTFGEPGGGKTFITSSLLTEFYYFCLDKQIPVNILTHNITDYVSDFQNRTAMQLQSFANDILRDERITIVYIADAHTVFSSVKDDSATQESKQTQAVYYKLFDGSMIPKNGRVMFIMDANYVDGFDPATKSRVMSDMLLKMERFQKPEDFTAYSQRKITSKLKEDFLKPNDWSEIGNYIFNNGFSNREVDNVLKSVIGGAKFDETTIGMKYADLIKLRNDQLRGIITKDYIIGKLDNYKNTMMNIDRASFEAKYTDDIARFQENSSAEYTPKTGSSSLAK